MSTTVPYAMLGQAFELATFGASTLNTPVRIEPTQFDAIRLESPASVSLRHLRDGLSARLPTIAFASFWNSLERLAVEEARAKGHTRKEPCPKCGTERNAGWDLKPGFERMYMQAELEPKLFKVHRKRRGTIQHGAHLTTTKYLDEIYPELPKLQTAAVVAVADHVGIQPRTIVYMSKAWPIAVFSCRAVATDACEGQFKATRINLGTGKLPQRFCGEESRTIEAGMKLPPKMDPLAFPPIVTTTRTDTKTNTNR